MAWSGERRVVAWVIVVVAAAALVGRGAVADFAADKAECADKLVGLATCLTYVEEHATAQAPTPDCCAGLKQVLEKNKKCLCVLVKDRDNPNLGFRVNVTRAMAMPAICNSPTDVSECPKLLNMPANAKEAQIFWDYAKQAGNQTQSATKPSGSGSSNGKSASAASAGAQKSGAAGKTRWLGVGGVNGATYSCVYVMSLLVSLLLA